MTREEALAVWAPDGSPWSPWTKPVLFSFLPVGIPNFSSSISSTWKAPLVSGVALMIELNGAEAVELGVALAQSGYRPIPLYNACPYPIDADPSAPTRFQPVIDIVPILRALERNTGALKNLSLPPAAPPAFLLDANRNLPAQFSLRAGYFDNRSIVRESDLPSTAFLKTQGIEQVILIQANPKLQRDLKMVLLSWQEGGLPICRQSPAEPWDPRILIIPRPSRLKGWWDNFRLRSGYFPNPSGSFGRMMHGSAG